MIYTIKNSYLKCEISSLGAEIQSIKSNAEGCEYIWDGKSHWFRHAPMLFPFCGCVTDPYTYRGREYPGLKHGFIGRTEFDTVAQHSECELILTKRADDYTLSVYPFEMTFTARYFLEGTRLHCEYRIQNNSGETMPYMFGLHPAFVLQGEEPKESFYLDFGKTIKKMQHKLMPPFVSDETFLRVIEDGKLYLTDEIYEEGTIVLDNAGVSVDFHSPSCKLFNISWSDNFKHLCVWKWPDDAARFVCIEPWSTLPSDGTKTDDLDEKKAVRLEAGGEDNYSCVIDFCL